MLVPLNSPISSIVPANRQIIWAASRVDIEPVSETELAVTCTFLGAMQPAWSLTIGVTDDDPQMVAGRYNAIVVADRCLLLKTEAQQQGGGSAHNHKLHRIGSDGRLLWSLPLRTLDQVGLLDDKLLIVRFHDALDALLSQPPLEASVRDPKAGQPVASYIIPVPDHLWAGYQRVHGGDLRALLEHDGQHFAVRVSLAGNGKDVLPNGGLFLHVLPFQQTVVRRWGFVCPNCLRPGSLQITHSIQLAPDCRSDDILVQVVACNQCSLRALAVYEESRRGALDAEAWEHTGHRVTEDRVRALIAAIGQCPNPKDAGCACGTHERLGRKDGKGRWQGLVENEPTGTFPMRLVENK